MKSKPWGLAVILVVVAVLASATYAIAASNSNGSFYDIMEGGMMDDTNVDDMMGEPEHLEDENWWEEMREHMEDHMGDIEDEHWWEEMREHMEEHWEELERDSSYRYNRHGCH